MSSRTARILGVLAAVAMPTFAADHVVYEGDSVPGKGKHIVFIASDHEYRGEETCPAIARLLAKKYGFKCTVLFGQDDDGNIDPELDIRSVKVVASSMYDFISKMTNNLIDTVS